MLSEMSESTHNYDEIKEGNVLQNKQEGGAVEPIEEIPQACEVHKPLKLYPRELE